MSSSSSANAAAATNAITPTTRILRPRHTPTPKMSERKKALFTDNPSAAAAPTPFTPMPSAQRQLRLPATIDEDDSDVGPMSPLRCSPTGDAAIQMPARILRRRATIGSSRRLEDQYELLGVQRLADTPAMAPARAGGKTPMMVVAVEEKENVATVAEAQGQKSGVRFGQRKSLVLGGEEMGSGPLAPKSQPAAAAAVAASSSPARSSQQPPPPGISTRSFYGASSANGTAPLGAKKPRASLPASAAQSSASFTKRSAPAGHSTSSSSAARRLSAGPMLGRPLNRGHRVPRPKQLSSFAAATHFSASPSSSSSRSSHSSAESATASEPAKSTPAAEAVPDAVPEVRRFRNREEVIAAAHKLIESHSRITAAIRAAQREAEAQHGAAGGVGGGGGLKRTAAVAVGRPAPGGATKRRRATVCGPVSPVAVSARLAALSPLTSPTQDSNSAITQAQIDRLQRILKDSQQQTSAFELAARPLNWVGGAAAAAAANQRLDTTADMDSTFGQISVLDTTNAMNATMVAQNVEMEAAQPARKFFRSGARDASKHQYQHKFSGMVAPVKRGATGAQSGQPPSKRSNRAEYAELRIIQQDITDIISMLEESIVVPESTATPKSPEADAASAAASNFPSTLADRSNQPPSSTACATNTPTSSSTTVTTAATTAAPLLSPDPLTSAANYARFAPLLPYNTTDPQLGERQLSLLQLLDTHHICSDRTFRIFIAEPRLHEPEATAILDQLFQVDVATGEPDASAAMDMEMEPLRVQPEDGESEADMVVVNATAEATVTADQSPLSPASQISWMTSAMDLECVPAVEPQPPTANGKMFPIFSRETAASGLNNGASTLAESTAASTLPRPIDWRAYGRDSRQLQIDAGQRRFGGAQCEGCGMFYAQHEPEDEALHQQFHVLRTRLQFAGWAQERVVCAVPEWQQRGRVVCVTRDDTHQKRQRAAEIVALVDESLGLAERGCSEESVIYLAIARRQVVGVCVVEPLQLAHPMLEAPAGSTAPPMMDLTRQLPVRCGLSRLWVIEAYRRHGIGRRLFDAMREHYARGGRTIGLQELAFGGPTEAGCQFAKRMMSGAPVLVY